MKIHAYFLFLIIPSLSLKINNNLIGNKKIFRNTQSLKSESYDDNSYDLLDLSKPITTTQALPQEYSIDEATDGSIVPMKKNKKDLNLQLLDPEYQIDLEGKESWLVVVRDSIEQRLGTMISKKFN